jgi:hypothetical protein
MATPCTVYFVEALVNGDWVVLESPGGVGGAKFQAFTDKAAAKAFKEEADANLLTLSAVETRVARRVARGTARK